MYGGRRLPKRSIVGTRICAPWGPDGIFYPGVIEETKTKPNGEEAYRVIFDDGYSKEYRDAEIIGPGFSNVSSFQLKFNQKVYITLGSREVSGIVQKHRRPMDEVFIKMNDDNETLVQRKIDEVRLLESRKSARLQDHETDYLKLADMCPEPKKKATSQEIEVPPRELGKSSKNSVNMPLPGSGQISDEEATMDEVMAAMVLTSLSSSPVVKTPERKDSTEKAPLSPLSFEGCWNDCSSSPSSSGHFSWDSASRGSPSPPHSTGTPPPQGIINTPQNTPVDPAAFGNQGAVFDEGIDVNENAYLLLEEPLPRKRKSSTKTVYKCTWPGCDKILSSCAGMERHVRAMHLGPKADGDLSDHEEEFYYTEIETSLASVTDTFANMYTSSPPTLSHMDMARPPHEDPSLRYRRDHAQRENNILKQVPSPLTLGPAAKVQQPPQTYTWHQIPGSPTFTFSASPTKVALPFRQRSNSAPQRLHPASPKAHGTSTKTHQLSGPYPKKVRGETKKCRKVYGMENRDMWCTQCKWKKACVRFID
ncbi:zinc finger protein 704-like [Ptychodera flava]|uniref:zinc finger protein 704-like n=1 Tax=Ptychodera flava TaxID=63121 RepID=UPI00396A04F0